MSFGHSAQGNSSHCAALKSESVPAAEHKAVRLGEIRSQQSI